MDGLTAMLELRGGVDAFRKSKPGLYATISWQFLLYPPLRKLPLTISQA